MGKLKEIVEQLSQYCNEGADSYLTPQEAERQIRNLIAEQIVGPMERYETPPGNQAPGIRNEMRSEQLKKLEKL